MAILAGDTIVDLGNTLLPKEDSIVIVRKGFGRTRILVPYGIGILLNMRLYMARLNLMKRRKYCAMKRLKCIAKIMMKVPAD